MRSEEFIDQLKKLKSMYKCELLTLAEFNKEVDSLIFNLDADPLEDPKEVLSHIDELKDHEDLNHEQLQNLKAEINQSKSQEISTPVGDLPPALIVDPPVLTQKPEIEKEPVNPVNPVTAVPVRNAPPVTAEPVNIKSKPLHRNPIFLGSLLFGVLFIALIFFFLTRNNDNLWYNYEKNYDSRTDDSTLLKTMGTQPVTQPVTTPPPVQNVQTSTDGSINDLLVEPAPELVKPKTKKTKIPDDRINNDLLNSDLQNGLKQKQPLNGNTVNNPKAENPPVKNSTEDNQHKGDQQNNKPKPAPDIPDIENPGVKDMPK
jgi:hypothetical protein